MKRKTIKLRYHLPVHVVNAYVGNVPLLGRGVAMPAVCLVAHSRCLPFHKKTYHFLSQPLVHVCKFFYV